MSASVCPWIKPGVLRLWFNGCVNARMATRSATAVLWVVSVEQQEALGAQLSFSAVRRGLHKNTPKKQQQQHKPDPCLLTFSVITLLLSPDTISKNVVLKIPPATFDRLVYQIRIHRGSECPQGHWRRPILNLDVLSWLLNEWPTLILLSL